MFWASIKKKTTHLLKLLLSYLSFEAIISSLTVFIFLRLPLFFIFILCFFI